MGQSMLLAADGTFKRCSRCRFWKPLREFYPRPERKSGRCSKCRTCSAQAAAAAYRASAIAQQVLTRRLMLIDDAASALKRCVSPDHDGPNPLPVELFSMHDSDTGQLNSYCKICATIKAARWYQDNREQAAEYHAHRRQGKQEEISAQQRTYRETNRDEISTRRRKRYKDEDKQQAVAEQNAQYAIRIRDKVFSHYGRQCACCRSTERLEIDHVNGGGVEHRASHRLPSGKSFYAWLIRNDFPEGFQTLCRPCNASKNNGPHCRLNHVA